MPRVKKEILPPEHCASVKDYEQSKYWAAKSKALLDDKNCKCQICGRPRWKWLPKAKRWKRMLRGAIHHIRYNQVPYEDENDYMVLCSCCHSTFHDLLRYESLGGIYAELAAIVKKYFFYDGIDTFRAW